jgi:hypothetical protein
VSNDVARAADGIGVGVVAGLAESPRGTTIWHIDRWDEDATRWVKARTGLLSPIGAVFERLRVRPYQTSEVVGNLVTTAGWTRASNLLTNQGATQAMDATHTRIGAGNGAGTAAAGDTDLSASAGSTNRWFQLVSGAGTVSTNTLAFAATFGTADGNFAWNEFGIDVGNTASGNTVAALLYNHKTSIAQGTKASGQTWTATATITFT